MLIKDQVEDGVGGWFWLTFMFSVISSTSKVLLRNYTSGTHPIILETCCSYDCLHIKLWANLMMKIFHFNPVVYKNSPLKPQKGLSSGATIVWSRQSDLTNNVICGYRPYKWGHHWQPGRAMRCYLCWMCNGFAMESHTFRRKKHVGMCILFNIDIHVVFLLCVQI